MDQAQNTPEQILSAWLMLERLSEGDINLKDRKLLTFDSQAVNQVDYYQLFKDELKNQAQKKRDKKLPKNAGIIIYGEIFDFKVLIDQFRKYFNLNSFLEAETNYGNKFSFMLCFDKDLAFIPNQFFYSFSGYLYPDKIKRLKTADGKGGFREFETAEKNKLSQLFESEDPLSAKQFNQALMTYFHHRGVQTLEYCRYKFVDNLTSEGVNLHSFFAEDLDKAIRYQLYKSSPVLKTYLQGSQAEVNLDSSKTSSSFNPEALQEILMPKNFPMGRFLGKYSLSLMQQVSVNLLTRMDQEDLAIQSVNGPPGTGKTTLLQDVVADIIVQQARSICRGQSLEKTVEYDPGRRMDKLSQDLTKKGIMVVSSNNGAVQNIVNEWIQVDKVEVDEYKEKLKDLNYYTEIANEGKSSPEFWGLLSSEGGKFANIKAMLDKVSQVADALSEQKDDRRAYQDFNQAYQDLKAEQELIQKAAESYLAYKKTVRQLAQLEKQENPQLLAQLDQETTQYQKLVKDQADLIKRKEADYHSLINRLFLRKKYRQAEHDLAHLRPEYESNAVKLQDLEAKKQSLKAIDKAITKLKTDKTNYEKSQAYGKLVNPLDVYDHADNYRELQKASPWFDEAYRRKQTNLFILALRVRKQFLKENQGNLKAAVEIWRGRYKKYRKNSEAKKAAWYWINMAIPVISSTFASFSRMMSDMWVDELGYVICDEAGQATPQSALGALFRCHKFIAVGDPKQIKPVLPIENAILTEVSDWYQVSARDYLSDNSSVQVLADQASQYGYSSNKHDPDAWIGIPLWVHRRCADPMFSISNAIAYDNMMVLPDDNQGLGQWLDVKGKAVNKYVKEQGQRLKEEIQNKLDVEGVDSKQIYVISPFKNVANQLIALLRQREVEFARFANGKCTNIGTVHTFQGKEADIVYLVMGCDENSKGAASWAVSEPNIINVAATRAKKKFYIIGDRDLYKNLGCMEETIREIDHYNRNREDQEVDS
ncbi:DEAD/DEAH box helicase [Aerococcus sp. Group 1]|uniref:DEAD/DEAH box helicase n=1 Tax=Aerococcus urinae (strain CCUG 59500 / ACS-120-V-Col10a) TaxID=2976812 RepID=UPI000200E7E4|nr:ATP-binding protein [Aerococcus sp. Group 1]AEA00965.1 hypothetical protein HMPREF9243_1898 [Aerococcus sp. Group 1]MCY3030367.1 ATP-binding protein [Aerococcus sp. Group 1]MCY3054881.1 ATP-binding protein [Aerococcus sp. Group 1]MCY3056611.1 ATP-binding protein [Aerococcus sp. Group 1]MCY3061807.1 ATP-binding protein [Aerococcus sp. Group 1]